jgi:hypothetical protein
MTATVVALCATVVLLALVGAYVVVRLLDQQRFLIRAVKADNARELANLERAVKPAPKTITPDELERRVADTLDEMEGRLQPIGFDGN